MTAVLTVTDDPTSPLYRVARDLCAGENDTCIREIDWSHGEPGRDGLCRKHWLLKATPDSHRTR